MCGINGITQKNLELVSRMNIATSHRGPDGSGTYEGENVTLGHNRLAIIDTSIRGEQPMKSTDGSLVITYNGELYNYRELRKELSGYSFVSNTDTEVILAAYQTWGQSCLSRFNGIFAFAIWDTNEKKLFLARDPMGVKPLYYSTQDDFVIFSSEIKAILESNVSRKMDIKAFSRFMRVTDVVGDDTLFQEVKKLPPAHFAVIKNNVVKIEEYWNLDIGTKERQSKTSWHKRIQQTLDSAIERQLVSDRPVGVFLSGGIDSSSVLASVIKAEGTARTYTTCFEEDSYGNNNRFNDDAVLAKRTAQLFGTEHTEVVIQQKNIISLLEKSVWYMDEPSGCATALSNIAIAEEASKNVAVVLGGDGGDELFGGYTRYQLDRTMDLYQKLPEHLRNLLNDKHQKLTKLNTPVGVDRFHLFYCMDQQILDNILSSQFRANHIQSYYDSLSFFGTDVSPQDLLMEIDRHLLADGSLHRMDKLSMAAGVEGRVPLLDLELIQLASLIPSKLKISPFETKKIFRNAMRDRLPEYLFEEKKRGWSSPAGEWLKCEDFYEYTKEVLSPSYYGPTAALFEWDNIQKILDEHYSGRTHSRTLLWSLLSFQIWARQYKVTL